MDSDGATSKLFLLKVSLLVEEIWRTSRCSSFFDVQVVSRIFLIIKSIKTYTRNVSKPMKLYKKKLYIRKKVTYKWQTTKSSTTPTQSISKDPPTFQTFC